MSESLDPFADALARVLAFEGVRDIRLEVPGKGTVAISLDAATATDGLMPAFLAAGDALMRAATGGRGFGPRFEADADAVLGYRVADPGASRTVALLCATDAIRQIAGRGGAFPADDLVKVWREACAVATFEPKPASPNGPRP